jgi:hypothetical protein
MVKGAHEILDGVTSKQWQRIGRRFDARYIIDQLARIRIMLGGDFIGVRVKESPNLAIEISDVLFGPFDF